jgi:hypothetical protein
VKLFKTYLVATAALVGAVVAVPVTQAGNPTQAEIRALEIRGQAMNKLCPDPTRTAEAQQALCGSVATAKRPTAGSANASGGIDWADFGIGAGAMLGVVLLATGLLAGAHYGRKSGVRPRPTS